MVFDPAQLLDWCIEFVICCLACVVGHKVANRPPAVAVTPPPPAAK